MGNSQSIIKVNFKDIQDCLNSNDTIIINTLPDHRQDCLIDKTISAESEIDIINKCLKDNRDVKIIIYGESSQDDTVYKKYEQLKALGFYNVFIYIGGNYIKLIFIRYAKSI